jgi:hypothetical protein
MAACVSKGRLALFSDNKTKVSPGHSSATRQGSTARRCYLNAFMQQQTAHTAAHICSAAASLTCHYHPCATERNTHLVRMLLLRCFLAVQVRLAKEAQEAARTAVDLDPSNDLAHHLMGRWHFEMAQINFVLRQVCCVAYTRTHTRALQCPCCLTGSCICPKVSIIGPNCRFPQSTKFVLALGLLLPNREAPMQIVEGAALCCAVPCASCS